MLIVLVPLEGSVLEADRVPVSSFALPVLLGASLHDSA
jgi:hypothetical protein